VVARKTQTFVFGSTSDDLSRRLRRGVATPQHL